MVDFPLPLEPTSATFFPFGIVKLTFFNAGLRFPYANVTFETFISPSILSIS